jgi:rare lipoprotein A
MKHLIIFFIIVFHSSCASYLPAKYIPKSGGEYVTASWYGSKFHGRPTASGERYDMYGFTAAHKKMKFGTRLRVTNPDNNKSIDVTVNDRGPFIRGRDLDLSYGAAKAIGLTGKGVGRVRIEYLGRNMRYAKRLPYIPSTSRPSGYLTVQVGSFTEKSNAERLKDGLRFKYSDVSLTNVYVQGQTYYRVRVGRFSNYDNAYSVAEKLADEGYTTLITAMK